MDTSFQINLIGVKYGQLKARHVNDKITDAMQTNSVT
jgi:hypothetical protein